MREKKAGVQSSLKMIVERNRKQKTKIKSRREHNETAVKQIQRQRKWPGQMKIIK